VTSLAAGVRLGVYRVESLLGAGGMGEVYLARDTRLDRDVALKVLPDLYAADPDRLVRFEREARVSSPSIGSTGGRDAHSTSSTSCAGSPRRGTDAYCGRRKNPR
jgi:serine/threonine protein kinase